MRVHRNLHKAIWSLTEKGKVTGHAATFALAGVRFIVSEATRQRVIAPKQPGKRGYGERQVHAWAEGQPVQSSKRRVHAWAAGEPCEVIDLTGLVEVTYNPYRAATFTTRAGAVVWSAELVVFHSDGKAYALNPSEEKR